MPAILINVRKNEDLLSHKTYRVQIYTAKTVQTEILFILFTLHWKSF